VDLEQVQRWIDGYVQAWTSNDAQAVGALFAEDARYYTHPFREPWKGRQAIVDEWTANPDRPGSWRADYKAIAAAGDIGVVRGNTTYLRDDGSLDKEYANVFVIEFDRDGLAREFTEFFMASNPKPRAN